MKFSLFTKKAPGYECLGPSTIAEATSFSNSCDLALWTAARYKPPTDDKFLAEWRIKHTSVLNDLAFNLKNKFPSSELDLELPLKSINLCGMRVFGTPDLIRKSPEGKIFIYDAKSGKKRDWHLVQIGLYGILLQGAARAAGKVMPDIEGFGLYYGDGSRSYENLENNPDYITIEGENAFNKVLPDPIRQKIKTVLTIAGQNGVPNAKPSSNNCRFCKFKNGCTEVFKETKDGFADSSDLLLSK
tara:strand:- start:452 stop:1183 length:732 start_codon:yes stop_codon:yes gene_type:complete